jgi:DNA-binding response OmpR family regulator
MHRSDNQITKVLLIDDDPEEFFIFETAVQDIDSAIKVSQLKGFTEDLTKNCIDTYDLIFLDINMPLMDGFTWLSKLREAGYSLPVVMYSTTIHQGRINRAYESGAHLFLPKPDNFDGLVYSLSSIFQLNWNKPEDIKQMFFQNGEYLPFSAGLINASSAA